MKKLAWDEICKQHNKEWVHLIDYDWTDGQPYPNSGVVRIHAKTRKEFNKLILEGEPISGARIFVGHPEKSDDLIMMGNYMRITCA